MNEDGSNDFKHGLLITAIHAWRISINVNPLISREVERGLIRLCLIIILDNSARGGIQQLF